MFSRSGNLSLHSIDLETPSTFLIVYKTNVPKTVADFCDSLDGVHFLFMFVLLPEMCIL